MAHALAHKAGRIELGGLEDQAKRLNERTARRP